MNLNPSPEQAEIMESVAGFLSKELPVERLRTLAAEKVALDDATWTRCAEMGWIGLGVDVQYTRVTGLLGKAGTSQAFGEDDLGGTAARVKVLVGR